MVRWPVQAQTYLQVWWLSLFDLDAGEDNAVYVYVLVFVPVVVLPIAFFVTVVGDVPLVVLSCPLLSQSLHN
jgi:hypothetical protein